MLSLPDSLHEPAFMLVQYSYALVTMLPCPLWFWYRWLSAGFLLSVFTWSIYNGATYYIDVFGTRFQKELDQLKKEVSRWQTNPEALNDPESPSTTVQTLKADGDKGNEEPKRNSGVDSVPMLESKDQSSSGFDSAREGQTKQRK